MTDHALTDRTVLVTGANRGLGRALVDDALRRGAAHVYAAGRRPAIESRERVTAVPLDVTDPTSVRALAARIEALDVLDNNAGVSLPDGSTPGRSTPT
jgi:NAD(P)-dependent dehydrogenase (short-subunit alcohol dehydrogenase family)